MIGEKAADLIKQDAKIRTRPGDTQWHIIDLGKRRAAVVPKGVGKIKVEMKRVN